MSCENNDEKKKNEGTVGQRVADRVALIIGSWTFILIQLAILLTWAIVNSLPNIAHWDPYPWIAMNLALSAQAAFATPLLLMSQNRQAEKDRQMAQCDLEADLHEEVVLEHVRAQLLYIVDRLDSQDDAIAEVAELARIRRRRYRHQDESITPPPPVSYEEAIALEPTEHVSSYDDGEEEALVIERMNIPSDPELLRILGIAPYSTEGE